MSSFRQSLRSTGFARISGKVSANKKRKAVYSFVAEGSTPYTIEASNIQPGENIKFKVKDNKGVIARARQSYGSNDPHLHLSFEDKKRVKIIVTAERDSRNKGRVPFNLAISHHEKIRGHAAKQETSQVEDVNLVDINTTTASNGSLGSLWNQLKSNNSPLIIDDLDSLLGATIADDGTVSQSEINLLGQIHSQLSKYVSSENLDYYDYIFGAAIGSNPANAYYTGGVSKPSLVTKLGNLAVGFDTTQVSYLQKKWFRGEDLPLGQIDGDAAAGVAPTTFTYAEASGDLFDGSPSYQQLSQGSAGTCWFLSSLNAVANASQTSSALEDMFIDNKNGTFGVKFFAPYGAGPSAWVTVNRDLPVASYFKDSLMMAGSQTSEKTYNYWEVKPLIDLGSSGFGPANLTWAGLAEKALAQVNETGLLQRSSDKNSYRAIEGGLALGIDYITGSADFNSYAYESTFDDFKTLDPTVTPILLGSSQEWTGSKDNVTQLVSGHAYSIVDKNLDSDTNSYVYTVVNPWGETAFNYDATFPMDEQTLSEFFNKETVFLATTQ